MALSIANFRYFSVGPSSEHELRIARVVDQIDIEGRLDPSVVDEIIGVLDFVPSEADKSFLVGYLRWRMANPIQK
jgi:hypothetical protein